MTKTKHTTKSQSKAISLRKLREAKAAKPASAAKPAKAKPPAKKPALPIKAFADLRKAPAVTTPRPDKVRSDTIALNLLVWDTAELESAKVSAIASSFRETSTQISRISIRPAGKRFRVVAGRHRCEAAKSVGWTELKYELLPYETSADKLNAELIEIDENLCRKNLSPATEAALTARRKAVYEKLHPATSHGGARKKPSRQTGDLLGATDEGEDKGPDTRFTEATAQTAGRSERSVQRAASRGEAIGATDLTRIMHTSLDKGEELDALAKLDPKERKAVMDRAEAGEKVSAKTELKKQTRATKERTLGGLQLALPDKKYGVILADPEWRFEPWSLETGMSRAPDYPTSCTEVIAARDVPSIAADDSVLFLCATAPMLPHALLVMAAWGFNYVSNYVLEKDRIITGYWNRNKHEHLLIGTRGKIMCPAPGTQWDSIIPVPVGVHSDKGSSIQEMIEQYFPTLPKTELNRRGPARPGWDAWGNEAAPAASDAPATPPETERTAFDGDYTEQDALYAVSTGWTPVAPAIVALLKEQKLIRGSVKLNLTKAGIARLENLRKSASSASEVEQSSLTTGPDIADRGDAEPETEKNIPENIPQGPDCRVCGDGNGLCAQCLPAEAHTVSHTNPNGEAIATCTCGWKHATPWGDHGEIQDRAVQAHWQSVVDEARAAGAVTSPPIEGDGLGVPAFLWRAPAREAAE